VRALLLTGPGGAFCAGADVKTMENDSRTPLERRFGMEHSQRVCRELALFDRPVVAAADGVAYGAGFSLLLHCDFVLLSTRARLCMVFHRIGLVPDVGALYTLPRIVGLQRAKEIVFSAREIAPNEALRIGIAAEVHPPTQLMDRALAVARSLVHGPTLAQAVSKRVLSVSMHSDLNAILEIEASAQALAGTSADVHEAVRRFRKREPARFQWPAQSSVL